MTTAQELDGKLTEEAHFKEFELDPKTLIYTFKDGSKAIILTHMIPCEPYMTASLSTMSIKAEYRWKAK